MELDYKRIVVTFLMHLGDVILTTPFLDGAYVSCSTIAILRM